MLALFRTLFTAPPNAAREAYIARVERARNPFFYESLGVPDTLDGRFELIVLHLFLLQQRLLNPSPNRGEARRGAPLGGTEQATPPTQPPPDERSTDYARQLSEWFFADMDSSVRELGVADTGVRYRIKAMAKAYHGRLQAYTAASADATQLASALARNLYGTVAEGSVEHILRMAEYVRTMQTHLATVAEGELLSSHFVWPEIALERSTAAAR